MNFVLQVIGWIIFIYGFLSLAQDIINEVTYKKISHNMKIIVLINSLENNLENFVTELSNLKKNNNYKKIVAIDLDENDNLSRITKKLEDDDVNIELLDKHNGRKIIDNYFQNENISFL
jgi:dephospho-CoA kinase